MVFNKCVRVYVCESRSLPAEGMINASNGSSGLTANAHLHPEISLSHVCVCEREREWLEGMINQFVSFNSSLFLSLCPLNVFLISTTTLST